LPEHIVIGSEWSFSMNSHVTPFSLLSSESVTQCSVTFEPDVSFVWAGYMSAIIQKPTYAIKPKQCVVNQGRRSHRIIGGHKRRLGIWGTKTSSGVQGRSPGRGSGGRSPPEAKAFHFRLWSLSGKKNVPSSLSFISSPTYQFWSTYLNICMNCNTGCDTDS